uniref:C-type lectin domain-containing protein n=1 Tax=Aquila chrysaetos chrysaetos TaxID=223781 RepID=A0A663F5Q2_AQUCH
MGRDRSPGRRCAVAAAATRDHSHSSSAADTSVCRLCPAGWQEKCFYFVEDEADWNRSQISCLSLGAHLATIDTQEELHFLFRYGSSLHYWIGLHREGSGPWKWFEVRGKGQCAYIDADGISSDWCSQMKYSAATHKSTLAGFRRIQKS